MNEIGGFFGLELSSGNEYHKGAIRLNTGRNAFEYILKAKNYSKVYMPYFTCSVMLEPIKKLDLDIEFYHVDAEFYPKFNFDKVQDKEVFLYTNYFGICDHLVERVMKKVINLIVDNSQAFYSKPINGIDTFYSARKFFGVPDGAYLYTETLLDQELEQDTSINRFEHLIGRVETNAKSYYSKFKESDNSLKNQPIKTMSIITQKILDSLNYKKIANVRRQNFEFFENILKESNMLNFDLSKDSVPMIYPYFVDEGYRLKNKLIEENIFVATYWPNVLKWTTPNTFEFNLTQNLLSLPIDQRYDSTELLQIKKNLKE